ncbi:glycosyltransferase family 2 protein [Pontibacter sp. BT731]|uniref:glycosyltransferase family 2 protein n=1 Tax=Pontibacter coccineus TaxID=3063328 RepID=UPI0026E17A3F|nr:glycosyltransferase family 2 protein [Pontibacter sp. BT731]MDO6390231.1 glycosyltransferase family 2 protein [Pontibacter sp. BT731]
MESQLIESDLPLVSICCITYNHKDFIADALNGFISQQTNFRFEIIIHDDASTDGTTEIVRQFELKYAGIVKPIYQLENQFSKGKKITAITLSVAKGKYVALCEGDDFWIDPFKLQKQVDFLESNPNYVICFHGTKISRNGEILDDYITKTRLDETKTTYDIFDLSLGNFIHTPTIVFRNIPNIYNDPLFVNSPIGDYILLLLLSKQGLIKRLTGDWAVYRVHGGGIWSSINRTTKNDNIIKYLIILSLGFKHPAVKNIKARLNKLLLKRIIDNTKSLKCKRIFQDIQTFYRVNKS